MTICFGSQERQNLSDILHVSGLLYQSCVGKSLATHSQGREKDNLGFKVCQFPLCKYTDFHLQNPWKFSNELFRAGWASSGMLPLLETSSFLTTQFCVVKVELGLCIGCVPVSSSTDGEPSQRQRDPCSSSSLLHPWYLETPQHLVCHKFLWNK